jgi:hypothetical protein
MTESADEIFVESAFILLIRMILMDVKLEYPKLAMNRG